MDEGQAGGQRVPLQRVDFRGNTLFDDERLHAALGEAITEPQDMAGLQALANRISQFYRDNDYPFARALLPHQDIGDGVLTIEVIEGRYDRALTSGPDPLASDLQPWLAPFTADEPIASTPLTRQLLLIGDLPGIEVTPVMRPGRAVGTAELEVQVAPGKRVTGNLGVDNHGSRYSGEYRGRAGVSINRLATLGDELNLTALYTSQRTWLGNIDYERPLGTRGLRGRLGYAHTDYRLGKGFEGYTGTADVYSAQLSYPLLRSQSANLLLSGGLTWKALDDNIDLFDYRKATDSHSLPLRLTFDARDPLGNGGITWGAITFTPGTIDLAETHGGDRDYGFTKLALDISRLQSLGDGVELYARLAAQWADRDDIDGSESFDIGGPYGVRAYPVGEGSDARGALAQLEARYRLGHGLSPYLFFDTGYTPDGGIDEGESRRVSGAGLGLRYQRAGLRLNFSTAWPTQGGNAQSDDHQRDPRVWASVAWQF